MPKAFSVAFAIDFFEKVCYNCPYTKDTHCHKGGNIMNKPAKYYIIETSVLPEVFLKVAETKRLLQIGAARTVHEATRMTRISRSAFYKYKDAVIPFQNMMTGRIITFQFLLHDKKGLLSSLLAVFAKHKAILY